jgi:hypothetical protein
MRESEAPRVHDPLQPLAAAVGGALVMMWVRSMFVGDTFFRHFDEEEGGIRGILITGGASPRT